jgi:hypothetical protein
MKFLVFDQIAPNAGKAYINHDLIAAVLDRIEGCVIVCGNCSILVAPSSKEVVQMIREAGRVL